MNKTTSPRKVTSAPVVEGHTVAVDPENRRRWFVVRPDGSHIDSLVYGSKRDALTGAVNRDRDAKADAAPDDGAIVRARGAAAALALEELPEPESPDLVFGLSPRQIDDADADRRRLLARLLGEQTAGWAGVTPAPVPRVLVVVATTPLSPVDERHARDAARQTVLRHMRTQARGDRRTRQFMSPAYTVESRRRAPGSGRRMPG